MQIDIPRILDDLGRIVDRLAELREWQRLDQRERRRPFATSFDLDIHLAGEMSDLRVCFADADFSLHELLARPDLEASPKQRREWERRLDQLEHRAGFFRPPAGLKSPEG